MEMNFSHTDIYIYIYSQTHFKLIGIAEIITLGKCIWFFLQPTCINCFISLIGHITLFEGNVHVFLFGLSVCFGGVTRLTS